MLGDSYFFHDILRKSAAIFGTLFNEIYIQRENTYEEGTQLIRVPITYAAKDKTLVRVKADPDLDKPAAIQLPRMSFLQVGIERDSSRKLQTLNRFVGFYSGDSGKLYSTYSPVPVKIFYELYVYVKNISDGHKIVEQIVPYFTPDWTVSSQLIDGIDRVFDIPITMAPSITYEDSFTGSLDERRIEIYTMRFNLETYFFGPVKPKPIIKFANTGYWAAGAGNTVAESMANSSLDFTITTQPGMTANGTPTNKLSESVPVTEIWANSDFGYIFTSNNH